MAQQPPQQPYNPQQQYAPQPHQQNIYTLQCWNCNQANQYGVPVCSRCGAQFTYQQPAYQPPPPQVVVVEKKGMGCGKILLALIGVVVVLAIIGSVARPGSSTTGNRSVSTNPGANSPTSLPAARAPSYAQIAAKKAALTDAQWDEYAETLAGLRIEGWQGTVLNVDQKVFSDNYWVSVDLDGEGGVMNVAEAKVEVTKEDALTLSKGQTITFSGTIDKVTCILTYCPIEVIKASFTVK